MATHVTEKDDGSRSFEVDLRAHSAGRHRGPDGAVIRISSPLLDDDPEIGVYRGDSVPVFEQKYRDFYLGQARELHEALLATLPGGTYDALFALMAHKKASLLVVPAQDA